MERPPDGLRVEPFDADDRVGERVDLLRRIAAEPFLFVGRQASPGRHTTMTDALVLQGVTKRFGTNTAVDGFSIEVRDSILLRRTERVQL
jgi:hypothetical protein